MKKMITILIFFVSLCFAGGNVEISDGQVQILTDDSFNTMTLYRDNTQSFIDWTIPSGDNTLFLTGGPVDLDSLINVNSISGSDLDILAGTGDYTSTGTGSFGTVTDGTISITAGDITNVNSILFDLTPTVTPAEGLLHWNDDAGTISFGMPGGNVEQQVGQELFLPRRVKNNTASPMLNGQLVYISGGDGTNAYVSLAQADTESTSAGTIAMLTEDIAASGFGYATTYGLVRGEAGQSIDTSAYSPGDVLYLSPTTAGGFTGTKPDTPNHLVSIGTVFRSHATEGQIIVRIINGFEIEELHNVLISSLADNHLLQYNASGSYWENKLTVDGITLGTPWTLSGDGSWTGGAAVLDASDTSKTVKIYDTGSFTFGTDELWLALSTGGNTVIFGNTTDNPAFTFRGSGLTSLGGDLLFSDTLASSYIGAGLNSQLIELDGSLDEVTVNGDMDVTDLINIATTTSTVGQITQNDIRFLHSYGTNNTFLGNTSGNFALTGTGNVGVGDFTLGSLASGIDNVAIGRSAGAAITDGDKNVCLGFFSGGRINTGNSNMAIGFNTLSNLTTGSNNTGVGNSVLNTGTSLVNCVGIGISAGTVSTGINNTFVGANAGFAKTSGNNNLYIGAYAGRRQTTSANQIIIDNQSRTAGQDATWAMIIGTSDASTLSNQVLQFNANTTVSQDCYVLGNTRIGDTTTPTEALEVAGTVKTEGGRIKNTTRITSASSPYTVLSTDHEIFADTDGGAIIVNLPAGIDGTNYRIINTGSSGNDITLNPNGVELLAGANSSVTLIDGEALILTYETTEGWW